jgi:hypothetical protein
VSFAAITLCVASQRVFIAVVVYFVIDSVRRLLDTLLYVRGCTLSSVCAVDGWRYDAQSIQRCGTDSPKGNTQALSGRHDRQTLHHLVSEAVYLFYLKMNSEIIHSTIRLHGGGIS